MPMTTKARGGRHARVAGTDKDCADGTQGCEISELFHILGKSYNLEILHLFLQEDAGPQRFVEIQTRLKMSPNTLSDRLKDLVGAGILSRTAYNEIPPRVDYQATSKALDLRSVFDSLAEWADRHTLKPEPPPKSPTPLAAS